MKHFDLNYSKSFKNDTYIQTFRHHNWNTEYQKASLWLILLEYICKSDPFAVFRLSDIENL